MQYFHTREMHNVQKVSCFTRIHKRLPLVHMMQTCISFLTSFFSCLGAGLASWCFNLTTQSGECQRAQPQSGGNGRCQMSRGGPGYFCSACDDQW